MFGLYFCTERAVNQTPLCQLKQHRLFFYTAVGLIDTVGCGALFLNNYPALFQNRRSAARLPSTVSIVRPSFLVLFSDAASSLFPFPVEPRMTDIGIETGRIRSSAGFQNTFTDLNATAPTGYDSRGGV